MKLNVFEGARRILRLLQGLWVLGAVAWIWLDDPTIYAQFETFTPEVGFIKSIPEEPCYSDNNASEYVARRMTSGHNISITLCFKSVPFPSGNKLVPYRVADDG